MRFHYVVFVACVLAASSNARADEPTAARKLSGLPMPIDTVSPGTAEVKLAYDTGTTPPARVVVSLVSYAADDSVKLVQAKTDAKGVARFTKLVTSGAVAYYALAQLPRKHGVDRLVAQAFVPDAATGVSVHLTGGSPTEATIDELVTRQSAQPAAVARGKVLVRLEGAHEPDTSVEIFDAANGKSLAKAKAKDPEVTVAVPARAGQVVYAVATRKGAKYRSLPFQMVPDRGALVAIYIYPRLLPTFQFVALADDNMIAVRADISLSNNSWLPYAEGSRGPTIALPRGATKIAIDGDPGVATIKGEELQLTRPVPPGPFELDVTFELAANQGNIAWSLDLPYGAFKSSFYIEDEAGLSIDHLPAGLATVKKPLFKRTYLTLEDISITPKQRMDMVLHLPKPRPETALLHACRILQPDVTPLVGKPLDFTLAKLDGTKLKLSSLRGKPMLVNLMATWDMLSKKERPTLATLAQSGIVIVMVASDNDPKLVASTVGKLPFAVVLDPPASPNNNIGKVTSSLGIVALPESVLVDAKGIVRYHFQNARAWDAPEAVRCVKAFMAAK